MRRRHSPNRGADEMNNDGGFCAGRFGTAHYVATERLLTERVYLVSQRIAIGASGNLAQINRVIICESRPLSPDKTEGQS